jgi:hypothetical protein
MAKKNLKTGKKPPFSKQFPDFTEEAIVAQAIASLAATGHDWDEGIETILRTCCRDPDTLFPTSITATSLQEYVDKWVRKYCNAYANRPSRRVSGRVGTIPDPIINAILETRLSDLMSGEEVAAIVSGHRLAMSAENIVGAILEEYLAERLKAYGWYCAWGETMRVVDLCSRAGDLLQVKNRDNTENSSSGAIRDGTTIQKWARGKSKSGKLNWESLQDITECNQLAEEDFTEFVKNLIQKNPEALFVEDAIHKLHQRGE